MPGTVKSRSAAGAAPAPARVAQPAAKARWYFHVVWFPGKEAVSDPDAPAPRMYFQQRQFDVLNQTASDRGHFLVMPRRTRFDDIRSANNVLAGYCNDFHGEKKMRPSFTHQQRGARQSKPDGNPPVIYGMSAEERAEAIARTYRDEFNVFTGPRWVFLNEISRSMWLHHPKYPRWLAELARHLAQDGFEVVIFSPLTEPESVPGQIDKLRKKEPEVKPRSSEQNIRDWSGIAEHARIAIESYLSGPRIIVPPAKLGLSPGAWCRRRYAEMLSSYHAVGVPTSKLFLCEHFAQTKGKEKGGPRGRWGVSDRREWSEAIVARSRAASGLVPGYVTYGWPYNQMTATENELVEHAETFLANLPSLLPKPRSKPRPPSVTLDGEGAMRTEAPP